MFKLISLQNSILGKEQPDVSLPYAELWMGTHKSFPSNVLEKGEIKSLRDAIDQDRSRFLGDGAKEGEYLPFLFKVLSINKVILLISEYRFYRSRLILINSLLSNCI